MADLDRLAVQVSDGLRKTLSRISKLVLGVVAASALIGVATFVTGLFLFERSRSEWIAVGGAVCAAPIVAALLAWYYVHTTAKVAPNLVGDVSTLLRSSRDSSKVLINYDTGERLADTAKTFGVVRHDLRTRRRDMPALFAGVRAITSVPGLSAIALLGSLAVGALGTIMFLFLLIG